MRRAAIIHGGNWPMIGWYTMAISLLITAIIAVVFSLSSGQANLMTLTDTFLTVSIGGLTLFGPFVFLWGYCICWAVVPVIWRLRSLQSLEAPLRAAFCALIVALIGFVGPLLVFGFEQINSFATAFFLPAAMAIIIAPVVAFYVHRADAKVKRKK